MNDTQLPDPGLGRNPPRYARSDSTAKSSAAESVIIAALIAAVIVGLVLYSGGDTSNPTASNPAPTTTGQGGAPTPPTNP